MRRDEDQLPEPAAQLLREPTHRLRLHAALAARRRAHDHHRRGAS